MSADALLDQAVRIILEKARQREREEIRHQQATGDTALIINFDGAGQPLTVGMGGVPQMPNGSFTIVGCHMAAGIWSPTLFRVTPVAASASVDMQLASRGFWAGGTISLTGGTRPALTSQAEADISLAGWITELQPLDMIAYALATFTGTATVLTLTLTLRRLDVLGIGTDPITDTTGDTVTDESGFPVVIRA